jgi:hypothetical protein
MAASKHVLVRFGWVWRAARSVELGAAGNGDVRRVEPRWLFDNLLMSPTMRWRAGPAD